MTRLQLKVGGSRLLTAVRAAFIAQVPLRELVSKPTPGRTQVTIILSLSSRYHLLVSSTVLSPHSRCLDPSTTAVPSPSAGPLHPSVALVQTTTPMSTARLVAGSLRVVCHALIRREVCPTHTTGHHRKATPHINRTPHPSRCRRCQEIGSVRCCRPTCQNRRQGELYPYVSKEDLNLASPVHWHRFRFDSTLRC